MSLRTERILENFLKEDSSKFELSKLDLLLKKNLNTQLKNIWEQGIKIGIELGLQEVTVQGTRINLTANIKNPRQKEFVEEMFKLHKKYNCSIIYHPLEGLTMLDLKNEKWE